MPKTTYVSMSRRSSASSSPSVSTQYWTLLFAGLSAALYLLYQYAFRPGLPDPGATKLLKDLANPKKIDNEENDESTKGSSKNDTNNTPIHSNRKPSSESSTNEEDEDKDETESENIITQLHEQIEEIDKRGKALFKQKLFIEAAEVFTEAIDLIHVKVNDIAKHGNLNKQVVTLMNNRSAMYEIGGRPDLALLGEYFWRMRITFILPPTHL